MQTGGLSGLLLSLLLPHPRDSSVIQAILVNFDEQWLKAADLECTSHVVGTMHTQRACLVYMFCN